MQELFDKICAGLASQNWERSMLDEVTGAYRSPCGLKCAIGWLIPDELYTPSVEGCTVKSFPIDILEESVGFLSEEKMEFLINMQCLHDYTVRHPDLKFAFKMYAKDNNLKWSF